jgi:hypothetical protein
MKQFTVNRKMGNGKQRKGNDEQRTGNMEYLRSCLLLLFSSCLLLASCGSFEEGEKRLTPQRSTQEIRIEQIKQKLENDPVTAVHLIGVYEAVYAASVNKDIVYDAGEIKAIKDEAISNIVDAQKKAIAEKNWYKAASLARSLDALDIKVEKTGKEPEILLEAAKDHLAKGQDLEAFLAASSSNEFSPLSAADAMIFLERAFKARQRRTARYFLNAVNAAKEKSGGDILIPSELE